MIGTVRIMKLNKIPKFSQPLFKTYFLVPQGFISLAIYAYISRASFQAISSLFYASFTSSCSLSTFFPCFNYFSALDHQFFIRKNKERQK